MTIAKLLVVAALLSLGQAGCRSSAPHYYLMSPQSKASASSGSQIAVGIGPIVFPEHLNRTQLVRRLSTGRVKLLEQHRWAEPLQANFSSTIAENLASLLSTEKIMIYPWQGGGAAELDLYIRVLRFEFDEDGAVLLSAIWSLTDSTGKVRALRHKTYHAKATTSAYTSVVAAMSQATASLSRDVASHITRTQTTQP